MGKKDEDLILEYQLGDISALEELFERYKHATFNYALRLLRNRADAEDVTSEIFLVLFSQKYTPRAGVKFSTCLYVVARNACISRMRKKKRWTSLWKRNKEGDEYEQWDIPDPKPLADKDVEQKETAWHVKKAIDKLPLEQKEAIIFREYQNLSYEEIAQVLNVSLPKVKILIFRARERLKKELASFIKEASDD